MPIAQGRTTTKTFETGIAVRDINKPSTRTGVLARALACQGQRSKARAQMLVPDEGRKLLPAGVLDQLQRVGANRTIARGGGHAAKSVSSGCTRWGHSSECEDVYRMKMTCPQLAGRPSALTRIM